MHRPKKKGAVALGMMKIRRKHFFQFMTILKIITANNTNDTIDTITPEQEISFAQQYLEDNYDGIFVYKDKVYYDEIPGYLPHIGEPQLTTSYRF